MMSKDEPGGKEIRWETVEGTLVWGDDLETKLVLWSLGATVAELV